MRSDRRQSPVRAAGLEGNRRCRPQEGGDETADGSDERHDPDEGQRERCLEHGRPEQLRDDTDHAEHHGHEAADTGTPTDARGVEELGTTCAVHAPPGDDGCLGHVAIMPRPAVSRR